MLNDKEGAVYVCVCFELLGSIYWYLLLSDREGAVHTVKILFSLHLN